MRLRLRLVVAASCALASRAGRARADGPTDDLPWATSVGRAGAGLVADDGAGALLAEPAGLARRTNPRGQAALTVGDAQLSLAAPGHDARVVDQAASALAPSVAAMDAVGRFVIGAGYATTAAWSRALPAPVAGQPAADVARLYPHRYAGLAGGFTRRTVAAGAAVRAADWLAIGVTARVDALTLTEDRRLWAGFAGRDDADDPARDVDLALHGEAGVVPGGAVGAMIAPDDAPVELAASLAAAAPAHLDGAATATRVGAPTVIAPAPTAAIDLPATVTARAGARWLAERWSVEVDGEVAIAPRRAAPRWTIGGVRVVDDTGASATLDAAPALLVTGTHGAVRAAVDVEVAPGLCWLTAGYAWASPATPRAYVAPAFADLGGHTLAAGVELTAAGFTITAGWSRTLARTVDVDAGRVGQVNPFDAGAAIANLGRYTTDRDRFALTIELALD